MPKIINAQNWDRSPRVRNLIIPRNPGEVLLECDQSQAEARIVAWYAQERTLKELFKAGKKVHEFVGSLVMEEVITKKTTPMKYETSKRIVHGSNYGMRPGKLAEILLDETGIAVSVSECKKRQNLYFQNFPRIISGFHMGIQQELRENLNVLKTPPIGMQRKFYTPYGDELHRKAYAHYPQNVAGWITNNGINLLYYNSWLKPHLYMQMHDAIILSVPKERLTEAVTLTKEAMTQPIVIKGDELVIPIDAKVGEKWGEMKDYMEEVKNVTN